MSISHYLVFGDLHGRILPAFRLATVWAREHATSLDGMLQVGDLGFFPDPSRMDKATQRHAKKDPLELGAQLIAEVNRLADQVFAEPESPATLWHTVGNHEDYQALDELGRAAGDRQSFPIDAYSRVRCIRDGKVVKLPGEVQCGALWGVDDKGPNARRNVPPEGRIKERSAHQLAAATMDVLLTHDSPVDAKIAVSGNEEIDLIIHLAQPAFAFFGHYHGVGEQVEGDYRETKVFHMAGLELRGRDGCAEEGSVGLLTWEDGKGEFEYLAPEWLKTFTRHNWKYR